jgi:hypothetical protein
MLCERFTIKQEEFPSPTYVEAWIACVLFKGRSAQHSLSYQAQREETHRWFSNAGIVSSKITHAFRVAGSRMMDNGGVGEDVSVFIYINLCFTN